MGASSVAAFAQSDGGINYLDYFAADNSMDNQPLIDTENHLRFFPVFSLKDGIYNVQMRVYRNYDPIPFCRDLDRMKEGVYWEGLLPPFRLGQGVHRVEVEVSFNLDLAYQELYNSKATNSSTTRTLANAQQAIARKVVEDSLRADLLKSTPTSEYGLGVEDWDIIVDANGKTARILYRNYNIGLRQNPALDPAEKLGIFRARYVPFAVIGGNLVAATSTDENRRAVFEIGLGFGDVTIASDRLFKPALSARRLGVVFAISEELFSDSATVRALALTYEFNAYGSIAVGANFPVKVSEGRSKVESYFSFGVNKKAFEALMTQIQRLFQ